MSENPWSDLPDELERLGKVPHEIGAVHAAIDPASVGPDGSGFADVWLQAAFEGAVEAELRLVAHAPEGAAIVAEPARAVVTLNDGEVKRVRLPFRRKTPELQEIRCMVEAPRSQLGAEARRIRPPWRLFDTVVQPDFVPPPSMVDLLPVGLVATVVRPLQPREGGGGRSEATRTERARLLPDFLVAAVVSGQRALAARFEEEITWQPGQDPTERPEAPTEWQRVTEPPRESSQCESCGNHVDRARALDLGMCTSCGARWVEG